MEAIFTPDEDWENQEVLDELIEDMENDDSCSIDRAYLYKELKRLIGQADARNNYIHFSWF